MNSSTDREFLKSGNIYEVLNAVFIGCDESIDIFVAKIENNEGTVSSEMKF